MQVQIGRTLLVRSAESLSVDRTAGRKAIGVTHDGCCMQFQPVRHVSL